MTSEGKDLWEKICNGDTQAFASLYDAFGTAMFSLSMQILHDRWDAEEIVQDTFAALWKKPTSYSPKKGKLRSWLLVLVRNRSIDRYRSRKRRLDTDELSVALDTHPHEEAADGSLMASQEDDRALLRQSFAKLPESQKMVLENSFFKGMAHSEIASSMNLSLGTVKSRIRLGLQKMRRSLPTKEL